MENKDMREMSASDLDEVSGGTMLNQSAFHPSVDGCKFGGTHSWVKVELRNGQQLWKCSNCQQEKLTPIMMLQ